MPELVINELNWQEQVGDGTSVVFDGQRRLLSLMPRTAPYGSIEGIRPYEEEFELIPRDQWDEIIAQKDAEDSWQDSVCIGEDVPVLDQDGLGYCWVYAATLAVMDLRALQGDPVVTLAPESVGGPVTGWINKGGWGADACKQIAKAGICDVSFLDKPNSLSPRLWKPGWEQEAMNHRAEWLDGTISRSVRRRFYGPTNFDVLATASFKNLPAIVGHDWWGHEIRGGYRIRKNKQGRYEVKDKNSWGKTYGENGYFWLEEGRGTPDDIQILVCTTPSNG